MYLSFHCRYACHTQSESKIYPYIFRSEYALHWALNCEESWRRHFVLFSVMKCITDLFLDRAMVFVLIGVIRTFYKYHQRLDPDCCSLITVRGQDTLQFDYTGTKHNHQGLLLTGNGGRQAIIACWIVIAWPKIFPVKSKQKP